ncbi:NAD(P) transhydrogenase subunit alpha [Sulfobacillus harzensis]|uniref:proton-translocating NAD(P)(+) transhydrogenase n=1 Tax=Sulfobacillus harzensis TaxID=2729629 RepID=A0A7Y0Q309_9FIRM|nr:NAD(P) transhydrogenase subunit alpha [Sulfobacillus harzensis]NMP21709.1 NAD(P) transhydrogenase subunit alpha [Sulfobacillus harzensis]
MSLIAELYIFVLAVLAGFQVIAKVPSILHTPLMSATNAIHGIILIGALAAAFAVHGTASLVIALLAVFFSSINLVGGFVVTDRILAMFRSEQEAGRSS